MSDKNILLQRAKSAVIAHDYDTAARLYKTLISENPDDRDLQFQLGNLYVKSGKDEQALSEFKSILKDNPKNIDVLIAIGGIYRRQKKFDESVAILESALVSDGDNPDTQATVSYNLGFTYRQMGRLDDAITCFEDVVYQHPDDVLAYNHLGAIYALERKHEKAINAYQKGLKADPNHPVILLNLAKSYEAIGERQKALSSYEAALRSKPGWVEAIDGYSDLLLKTNKVKEADDVVSNAIKINPDDVKMHTKMGHVYNRQSIFNSAEEEFKKALNIDDEFTPALTGMAFSQEKMGKNAEAVRTIQKAVELNPEDSDIIKQSAQILITAGHLPEAYAKLEELCKDDPDDAQTINLLGQYYICKGDDEKLQACADKLEKIDSTYKDYLKDWGRRFAQMGDEKTSEQYLKAAVEEIPGDAESKINLALLYEKRGNNKEALDLFRRAIHDDAFNVISKDKAEKLTKTVEQAEEKPDLAPDFSLPGDAVSALDDDGDIEEETEAEVEEEAPLLHEKKEQPQESASGFDIPKEDDDFEFGQFGMENLAENEDEKSFDQLVALEDSDDNLMDEFEDLVDDGAPVDADNDLNFEVMPDGSEDVDDAISTDDDAIGENPIDYDLFEDEDIMDDEPPMQLPKEAPENPELPEEPEEPPKKLLDDVPPKAPRNPYEDYVELNKIAEKMNQSAEQAMRAAQMAADSAERAAKARVTERIVEKVKVPEPPKETEEEKMMKKAVDMLPAIVGAIEDKKMLEKYKASVDMFIKLREMLDYLPLAKKKQFFTSKNRILLDYIIARLSGKPGLLATVNALINSGLITVQENVKPSDKIGIELVAQVLSDVRELSMNVKDEYLRDALDSEALALLERIKG
ncbi:MAG: tetratricopeptide repeat protein [Treponema sp.]|nr:tetratricopeptide repeat protein [Treponema sp.]